MSRNCLLTNIENKTFDEVLKIISIIYKIPSSSSWDSKLWKDGCCVPVINNKKMKIKKIKIRHYLYKNKEEEEAQLK